MIRWTVHVACVGTIGNVDVGYMKGKTIHRREDTIIMDLKVIGLKGMDKIDLAQNRV
jgi:hypothetical protein